MIKHLIRSSEKVLNFTLTLRATFMTCTIINFSLKTWFFSLIRSSKKRIHLTLWTRIWWFKNEIGLYIVLFVKRKVNETCSNGKSIQRSAFSINIKGQSLMEKNNKGENLTESSLSVDRVIWDGVNWTWHTWWCQSDIDYSSVKGQPCLWIVTDHRLFTLSLALLLCLSVFYF